MVSIFSFTNGTRKFLDKKQKKKFSIKDFFSKFEQIRRKL